MAQYFGQTQGMSKKPTNYMDVLKEEKKKLNLFKPQPTQKSGLSLIPQAKAEGTVFDNKDVEAVKFLIGKGLTQEEAVKKIVEYKKTQQPQQEQGGFLENFSKGTNELMQGVISQTPKAITNIAQLPNQGMTWASGKIGEMFGVKPEDNIFYTSGKDVEKTADTVGTGIKTGIQKFGGEKTDTTAAKVGEGISNIGVSIATPGGVLKAGIPLRNQFVRSVGQGVIDTAKYTQASEARMPTGEEAAIGGAIGGAFSRVGKVLNPIKNNLAISGLMNTNKLKQVQQKIITDNGEDVGEKVIKDLNMNTPEDVSKWFLDRGIAGSEIKILTDLQKIGETSKKLVDNKLLEISQKVGKINPGGKELDNARKALDLLQSHYVDKIGNEELYAKILKYQKQLKRKGGGLDVNEMNDIKRLLDNSELNPFTITGKVKASSSGLYNIRQGLKTDIENIAKQNGFDNIRLLNNETMVSTFLKNAISDKYSATMAQNLLSVVFNPRSAGVIGGGMTGYHQGETPSEKIAFTILGMLGGAAVSGPGMTTQIAKLINKITPSDKGVMMDYINSRGGSGDIPKAIWEGTKEILKKQDKSLLKPKVINNQGFINPGKIASDIKEGGKKIIQKGQAILKSMQDPNIPKAKAMYEDLVKKGVSSLEAQKQIIAKYGRNAWKGSNAGSIEIKGVVKMDGGKAMSIGRDKTSLLKKVVSPSDDLIKDARKYKSVDEFIDKKFNFIHESNQKIDNIDFSKVGQNTGESWYGPGFYLQEKGGFKIEKYGDIKNKFMLNPKAKIFNTDKQDLLKYIKSKGLDKGHYMENDINDGYQVLERDLLKNNRGLNIIEQLKKDGYSGINIDGELVIYNKDAVISESQLKQIYEQANKKLLKPSEKVVKPSDDLIKEARKYKSADEFINKQNIVFHGRTKKGGDITSAKGGELGQGTYFTKNKKYAEEYAKDNYGEDIKGEVIGLSTKNLNIKTIPKEEWLQEKRKLPFGSDLKTIRDKYIKKGYDGIFIENENQGIIFPEVINKIKTESQLKQIYEQSKKLLKPSEKVVKPSDDLIKEAKKYNSFDEFIEKKTGLKIVKNEAPVKGYEDVGNKIHFSDGINFVDTSIRETKDRIILVGISSKALSNKAETLKGSGLGTKVVKSLKDYADNTGKKLVISGTTNKAKTYWRKFDWLSEEPVNIDIPGEGIYRDTDAFLYIPIKSSK